jgi:hypothetical protein
MFILYHAGGIRVRTVSVGKAGHFKERCPQ